MLKRLLHLTVAAIVGACVVPAALAYPFYIDDFLITKNGGGFFHDGFDGPGVPPSAPNYPGGLPAEYGVNGPFLPTDVSGGKLRLDPLGQGVFTTNAVGVESLLQSANLLSYIVGPDIGRGLSSTSTFVVTGVFDLVAPGGPSFSYGLRLQDGTATIPNQDVIDFRVIDVGGGQMAVRLRDQDFVAGTVTDLETFNIDPTGHDAIVLKLARLDTGSHAITASFQYLSGGSLVGTPTVLTATGSIFNHRDWIRAGFRATAPIPEPETYAMLLAGLGLLGFMVRRRNKLTD